MQKKSIIYKSLICGGSISLAVLDTTALVNEAIARHRPAPVAAAALGRTLTAAAYLASWLKDPLSSLSVTVAGGGAGGKICVAADGALSLRGFIEHPEADLPPRADGKLDVGGCVGADGTLTVIRDDGEGLPFVGTSRLVSGEIAEDLSSYFLTSEQRPTAVALGVKIGTDAMCSGAGGVFLQPLPGADDEAFAAAERGIARFSALSSMIERDGAEAIVKSFGEKPLSVREVTWKCHCSRERAASAVQAMGRAEAAALLAERGTIEVHCHYCNTDYRFGAEDMNALFGENH